MPIKNFDVPKTYFFAIDFPTKYVYIVDAKQNTLKGQEVEYYHYPLLRDKVVHRERIKSEKTICKSTQK